MTSSELIEMAYAEGFDLAGICDAVTPPHYMAYLDWTESGYFASMNYLARHTDAKRHPANLLEGTQSILVVALNYFQDSEVSIDEPKIARYALGRDYHRVLKKRLHRIGKRLTESCPKLEWRACVDSAPLMERDFAQLAGIGWFGKNTMIINSKRGSWFVLGSLLLTERFEPSSPAIGGCGTCTACVDACPTGAIVHESDRWQIDARRCISYLTIEHKGEIEPKYSAKFSGWTFGCDICQEVCPFNNGRLNHPLRAVPTKVLDFLERRQLPELTKLVDISFEDWNQATQGSAIRRAGFEGLKRNARINLDQSVGSTRESTSA